MVLGSSFNSSRPSLVERYFSRLDLDVNTLDPTPTLDKLKTLQQRHLEKIPFENTAQHGVGDPASLDLEVTALKVLDAKRGGFCFEVNLLFGHFLEELGYEVTALLSNVWVQEMQVYVPDVPHVVLIVTCDDGSVHYSDVGFGEPCIHPLRYDEASFGEEQVTPDGMQSKLEREDENVIYYWMKDGVWERRLKWNYATSMEMKENHVPIEEFELGLANTLKPDTIFSMKMVVCKVTATEKVSISGNKLKVTSPRFGPHVSVTYKILESTDVVREAMEEHFGIPAHETKDLDLSRSFQADPNLWSQK